MLDSGKKDELGDATLSEKGKWSRLAQGRKGVHAQYEIDKWIW